MKAIVPRSYSSMPPAEKDEINRHIKKLAVQMAQEAVHERIGKILEMAAKLAVVTLVEDFGWGTDEKRCKGRLRAQRFVENYIANSSYFAERYGEAMDEALDMRLEKLNIEWHEINNDKQK